MYLHQAELVSFKNRVSIISLIMNQVFQRAISFFVFFAFGELDFSIIFLTTFVGACWSY